MIIQQKLKEYYVLPIVAYTLVFISIYSGLWAIGWLNNLPNSDTLHHWDAGFYHLIRDHFYFPYSEYPNKDGFFPGFPLFWRVTGLDIVGIAITNGLIYLISLGVLCQLLRPNVWVLGIFMATPFLFLMWVPNTEALFFGCSVIIIKGIIENKNKWLFIGFLLASFTRASYVFFLPAFVGMTLLSHSVKEFWHWKIWRKILIFNILPCALGGGLVMLLQFWQTGDAFRYFSVQSSFWGRQFSLPVLPLGSNATQDVFIFHMMALWFGMWALVLGCVWLVQWLRQRRLQFMPSTIEMFALIFIVMSLFSILFFNPRWIWNTANYNSTALTGLNRYLYCNAFFLIFLHFLSQLPRPSLKQVLILFIATHLLWLSIDSGYYLHIGRYWLVSQATVILLLLGFYQAYKFRALAIFIIVFSFICQCVFFDYFLANIPE